MASTRTLTTWGGDHLEAALACARNFARFALCGMVSFIKQMNEWLKSGEITFQQTVEHGIEQAPAAFLKLFSGENIGKMLVKL